LDSVTARELVAAIRRDRKAFDATLARVPVERLEDPALPGGWSVKDVLAHIAWGDRESAGIARKRALTGSELWNLSEDERNETVVRESRRQSLEEVVADYQSAFAEYLSAVAQLSDAELNDASRIEGLVARIPGWRPWRVLYDPGHYAEHRTTIREAFSLA
jgi:uncharacterized protein (TIGR03083 family)